PARHRLHLELATRTMKTSLTNLTAAEIAEVLHLKPFQGKQIFRWIHQKTVFDFDRMTDLSKDLRARLHETCTAGQLQLVGVSSSPRATGTKKALFKLADGETVESVLIREKDRVTICLSTQVGCAVKCSFCATGHSGYTRNLTPGEIVEQALHLLADENMGERTPNIVYMGMGEPFRNYDATVRSVRLLMSPDGLGIGARRITVSTVGEVKGIERFANEDWQVRLSVSLHAANDAKRSELIPLNRKYPIAQLKQAIRTYIDKTGRQITFEWTLLDGVNDSQQDAAELAALARSLQAHVNLIPYNPVTGLGYAPPPRERCESFLSALEQANVSATLRKEKGQDIDAACGQLRRRHLDSQ
ncbi:MAG: 23S rRNA (adenine(2503)-C(2))-methyltransferase RlmN, partial [Candidatus Hydrogenedentes bacterium]|nr:23S rRNA (adenine(2503)-C(2))-methyltransferase RlmN [Candidatus Hydrogenedentota bacterium]